MLQIEILSEGMSEAEVAELLRKEASNAYGIMAPSGPQVFCPAFYTQIISARFIIDTISLPILAKMYLAGLEAVL